IYCRCAAGAELDLSSAPSGAPVDDVARNHPARIVLIHHDADASEGAASLSIEVAVMVFGGDDMRYGVERIVIRTGAVAEALPPLLSPHPAKPRERLLPVQLRHRPGEASLAWLLAGWLYAASAEGGRSVSDSSITVSEDDALADAVLTASFEDGLQLRLGED